MKFLYDSLIFIVLIVIHVELLLTFSSGYYLLYFLNLFIVSYILSRKYVLNNIYYFLLHVAMVLTIINLNIYDELTFELFLYFNVLDRLVYVNSETMYVLSAIHILVFLNLKKFENIWAIIEQNLSRIKK